MASTIGAMVRRLSLAAVVGLVLAAGVAHAQSVLESARANLPPAIRKAGVLRVEGAMIWPPFNWKADNGEFKGMEVDLIRLLADRLGLKAEFADVKFATVIPSIETHRYDVAVGQLGVTVERLKVVTYVPNFDSGLSLLVPKGKTQIDINNLCGHRLAVTQGSAQQAIVDALSVGCVKAGKQRIAEDIYPDTPTSYLAVANGRGEGFMVSRAVGTWISHGSAKLDVAPGYLNGQRTISGFVIAQNDPSLKKALTIAMENAMKDGSYLGILKKYQMSDGALTLEEFHKPLADLASK